jgi:hypothetical protein
MSALIISQSMSHAGAIEKTMEATVELSTMTQKDEVHTTSNSGATKIGIKQSSSVSMSVQPVIYIFQPHSEWYQYLVYAASALQSDKSIPTWERSDHEFCITNILTRHVNCPCVESIQSPLVFAQFWTHQLMSAFMNSRVTLHAGAMGTTTKTRVQLFFGESQVRDFMPQSGGLRCPRASCRSLVDSVERCWLVDSAERLWLAVTESNRESPKTAPELTFYSDAETVVEARVESSKMTENCAEQNASSVAATGVEVSKLTSAFMPFQIKSRPSAGWFSIFTMQKSGDTASDWCLDHVDFNVDSSRLSTLTSQDELYVFQPSCLQRSKFQEKSP